MRNVWKDSGSGCQVVFALILNLTQVAVQVQAEVNIDRRGERLNFQGLGGPINRRQACIQICSLPSSPRFLFCQLRACLDVQLVGKHITEI